MPPPLPPSSLPSSKPPKPSPPQSFSNISFSASTPLSTQSSQRPPSSFTSSTPLPVQSDQSSQPSVTQRHQNSMMSALCAEIRASGVLIEKEYFIYREKY